MNCYILINLLQGNPQHLHRGEEISATIAQSRAYCHSPTTSRGLWDYLLIKIWCQLHIKTFISFIARHKLSFFSEPIGNVGHLNIISVFLRLLHNSIFRNSIRSPQSSRVTRHNAVTICGWLCAATVLSTRHRNVWHIQTHNNVR